MAISKAEQEAIDGYMEILDQEDVDDDEILKQLGEYTAKLPINLKKVVGPWLLMPIPSNKLN